MVAVGARPGRAAFVGKNGHIAFATNRDTNLEVYQMNVDGSHPVNLTLAPAVDDGHPSFTGNGTKDAYDSGDGGNNQEIYSMNANGLLQIRLTKNKLFDGEPSFSPDGKNIAFVSTRSTNSEEVFVIASTGTPVK